MDTLEQIDMFSAFTRMMKTSAATELLSETGQFTIFAPTNDAFGKIPDHIINGMISEAGQPRLKQLLSYHIVPGKLFSAHLAGRSPIKSVTGEAIAVTDNNGIQVNSSGLQARNIEATNGVLHGIDTVLTRPPSGEPKSSRAALHVPAPSRNLP